MCEFLVDTIFPFSRFAIESVYALTHREPTMNARRLTLLALLAMLIFGAIVAKAEEDADEAPEATADDEPEPADVEADEADSDPNVVKGVTAKAFFLKYDDMKVPAGERVETALVFTNAAGNPSYEVVFAAAHISPLNDHSRYVQNFSANVYSRVVAAGETATIMYSYTPDVNVDPLDYSMVVRLFFKNDENATFAVTAYNGTIAVQDPLGVDTKAWLTFAAIGGGIGFAIYWVMDKRAKNAAKANRGRKSTLETGTNEAAGFNPEYVSEEHIKFAAAMERKGKSRSASR